MVTSAARAFTGTILQVPPMHSAIRVDGKRMYLQARKGKTVALPPREVQVSAFEITSFELPLVGFRIVCSKGTYIRSLVRDIGEALETGAYLHALRRTRIGPFLIEDAQTVSDFVQKNHHSA